MLSGLLLGQRRRRAAALGVVQPGAPRPAVRRSGGAVSVSARLFHGHAPDAALLHHNRPERVRPAAGTDTAAACAGGVASRERCAVEIRVGVGAAAVESDEEPAAEDDPARGRKGGFISRPPWRCEVTRGCRRHKPEKGEAKGEPEVSARLNLPPLFRHSLRLATAASYALLAA